MAIGDVTVPAHVSLVSRDTHMTVAPAARGLGTKPLSEGCVFVLCSGAVFAELKLGLQRQNVATVIIGQHAGYVSLICSYI